MIPEHADTTREIVAFYVRVAGLGMAIVLFLMSAGIFYYYAVVLRADRPPTNGTGRPRALRWQIALMALSYACLTGAWAVTLRSRLAWAADWTWEAPIVLLGELFGLVALAWLMLHLRYERLQRAAGDNKAPT